jgi:hypothetical protein
VTKTVEFRLGGTLKILEPEARAGARVTLSYAGFKVTAWSEDMTYTLPDRHQVQVRIDYVDADNNPATVDGDVTWSSSDSNIATVTVDPSDSQLATVAAATGGTIGQVQITATADADLGEGTREIITTMDVEIVAGEAVAGTITPVGSASPIP